MHTFVFLHPFLYLLHIKDLQLQGFIVSDEFWPTFIEQKFELPSFVQK